MGTKTIDYVIRIKRSDSFTIFPNCGKRISITISVKIVITKGKNRVVVYRNFFCDRSYNIACRFIRIFDLAFFPYCSVGVFFSDIAAKIRYPGVRVHFGIVYETGMCAVAQLPMGCEVGSFPNRCHSDVVVVRVMSSVIKRVARAIDVDDADAC